MDGLTVFLNLTCTRRTLFHAVFEVSRHLLVIGCMSATLLHAMRSARAAVFLGNVYGNCGGLCMFGSSAHHVSFLQELSYAAAHCPLEPYSTISTESPPQHHIDVLHFRLLCTTSTTCHGLQQWFGCQQVPLSTAQQECPAEMPLAPEEGTPHMINSCRTLALTARQSILDLPSACTQQDLAGSRCVS